MKLDQRQIQDSISKDSTGGFVNDALQARKCGGVPFLEIT